MKIVVDAPENEVYCLMADYVMGVYRSITPLNEVFDEIKAEIEDTGAYEQEVNGKTDFLKGINYCLGVIDKYKAESEE